MALLPLAAPPRRLCLLRLSAVGDVSHVLPVVRTLQAAWPQTAITWIIGRLEHSLVGDVPGVEFIIFDKARRWRAYLDLARALRGRRFDVLLHMQHSLRASLASVLVQADVRVGFDRARAKDLQWLFTNAHIAAQPRQHVMDSFFEFARALGIERRELRWDIPVPAAARRFAEEQVPQDAPVLVVSPCSSMRYRNWAAERYAAVADYAIKHHGMRVVLTGGPSAIEQEYGAAITRHMRHEALNLIGRTSLKELLAVLARAAVVLAPDSGPAHLATAAGVPVIGLYATTNPVRARPYLSADYVVSRYEEAVLAKHGKHPDELPFGIRVRDPGTMERITVDEVNAMLDRVLADRRQENAAP
ncbi:MAG: glycosyltransferase family 9 protein [Thiohalomonadaceae bacterium]